MIPVMGIIVSPKDDKRYNNTEKIADTEFFVNSSINEKDFKYSQRIGIVKKLPRLGAWDVKVGDEVIVHHNVFRRYWGFNADLRDSDSLFDDDEFVCQMDQVFARKRDGKWTALWDYCFVEPIKSDDNFSTEKYEKLTGTLRIGNKSLSDMGINEGDKVGLTPYSEYVFKIDDTILYKTSTKYIYSKYNRVSI